MIEDSNSAENGSKNAYKQVENLARKAGLRVVASRYASKRGFEGWNEFKHREPTAEERLNWLNLDAANIDMMTGFQSKVIALDFDCEDEEIIKKIEHLLPPSICEKKGAKGWTRFFKYTDTFKEYVQVKCKGMVVLEILSTDKKTTMPPSKHPSGCDYVWTGEPLWSCVDKLEPLPPVFLSNIRAVLHSMDNEYQMEEKAKGNTIKINSGRNDETSSYLATIIESHLSMDEQLSALIEFDKENNEPPLFTDAAENGYCAEPYTNALAFYTNHLVSFNRRKLRENKEPIIPRFRAAIDAKHLEVVEAGKSLPKVSEKQERTLPLASASTALGKLQRTILENSYVKQPAFAVAASLALYSTLLSRKVVFEGMSPNLYILNIAASGAGKDAPQQTLKRIMNITNCDHLLGAGDYVSDASLTDTLETQPVRLDIMDEVSGMFTSVSKGDAAYNRKMGELYCELYSCSNDLFLGRQTASERKGKVNRPNVNLLGSTTPAAFSKSIDRYAIENGLLGRFIIFHGDNNKKGERLPKMKPYNPDVLKSVSHWANFEAGERHIAQGLTTTQKYEVLEADEEASALLESIFQEYEDAKTNLEEDDIRRPIVRRLYQQLLKISAIVACSGALSVPTVKKEDVEYAKQIIDYHYHNLYDTVINNMYESKHEEVYMGLLKQIPKEGISKFLLSHKTLALPNKSRDSLLKDMVENGHIICDNVVIKGNDTIVYKRVL